MSSEFMQAALIQGESVQPEGKKSQPSADTPAVLFFELLTSSFSGQAATMESASADKLISPAAENPTASSKPDLTLERKAAEPLARPETAQSRQTACEPGQGNTSARPEPSGTERQADVAPRDAAQPTRQASEEPQQTRSSEEAPRTETQIAPKADGTRAKLKVVQEVPRAAALRTEVQPAKATGNQTTVAQETIAKPVTRSLENALLGAEAQQRALKAGVQRFSTQDLSQVVGKAVVRNAAAVQPSGEALSGNHTGGEHQGANAQSQQSSQTSSLANAFAQAIGNGAETAASVVKQAATVARAGAPAQVQQASGTQGATPPAGAGMPTQPQGVTAGEKTTAPARSQQPVPAERVIRQIVQAARISVSKGREEIKLLLKPESLGTLRVKISVQGEQVTARITAESEGVRDLIEANVRQLQQALESQNLRVNQIVVELQGDGEAQRQAQQSGRGGRGGAQREDQLLEEESDSDASCPEQGGETESVSRVDLRV